MTMRRGTVQMLLLLFILMFAITTQSEAQGPPPQGAAGAQGAGQRGGGGGGGGRGGRGGGGPGLTLTSTALPDGGEIPARHAGQMGVSPALSWTNVPMGTVEFVLIMNDPEPVVPALSVSGDILHWMVVKIPATATSLPEGA